MGYMQEWKLNQYRKPMDQYQNRAILYNTESVKVELLRWHMHGYSLMAFESRVAVS